MSVSINGTSGITFNNSSVQAYASGLGSNTQTWQNVTSSRALGTTYTNSTGYPIMVIVGFNAFTGRNYATVGSTTFQISYTQSGVADGCGGFIVPAGSTYSVSATGSVTTNGWNELR